MYNILGADHQEYGPVPAELVLQWINEGRANANTRARLADSADWKRLGDFPEFAAVLPPPAPPPLAAPPCLDADALARLCLAQGYSIDAGHCVGRGWQLVKQNFWLTVGAVFVVSAIAAVPYVGALLVGVLGGGLYFLMLKLVRGQQADFGDAFAGFSQGFVQLLLAGLVSGILTGVGYLLCVLPGIYLSVVWHMTPALVIDKKLDFWPAMEVGRKVISAHWWQLFGLGLLCILVALLGLLACGVGIFVAMPVILAAGAYAYEDIFGAASGAPAQPV
jgi:hypothetical protein